MLAQTLKLTVLLLTAFSSSFCLAESDLDKAGKVLGRVLKNALQQKLDEAGVKKSPSALKTTEKFIKSEAANGIKYEISFDIGGQVFPAAVLTFQDAAKQMLEKERGAYMLGSFNGGISVYAQPDKPNTKVKVTVYPNEIIKTQTDQEFILADPNIVYEISPMIGWDYQKLLAVRQPVNDTFKIEIKVEDAAPIVKTYQTKIRSVNEAVLGYISREGKEEYLAPMSFAGFVNENNPIIDKILKETKELAIKAKLDLQFSGYQSGPNMVSKQVAAIWYYFQSQHFMYSSITTQTYASDKVMAQYIRSIEDSLAATQANCVDGTVLFASVLRKIGIEPVLILKPGHMYLMYFNDEQKKDKTVIETTMLGNYVVKNKGFLVTQSSEYQKSLKSFIQANEIATKTFNDDLTHLQKNEPGYAIIPIAEYRKLGFSPINR